MVGIASGSNRWLMAVAVMASTATIEAGERHVYSSTQAIGQPNSPDSDFEENFASSGMISSHGDSTAGSGHARSTSIAGFKRVKVVALATKLGGTLGGHGDASSVGSSTDNLTFSTREVPIGEPMTVMVTLSVDGDVSGHATCGQGQTAWDVGGVMTLYYGQGGLTNEAEVARGEMDNNPNSPNQSFKNGAVNMQFTWPNGVTFEVMMHSFAWASITALGACTGEAKSALDNTFTWMGVASVTDSQGNAITEYTLVDEFGNDWTTPPSAADITLDGEVNVSDLLALIGAWGACSGECPPSCTADITPTNGNCVVNVQDLLVVIANWDEPTVSLSAQSVTSMPRPCRTFFPWTTMRGAVHSK